MEMKIYYYYYFVRKKYTWMHLYRSFSFSRLFKIHLFIKSNIFIETNKKNEREYLHRKHTFDYSVTYISYLLYHEYFSTEIINKIKNIN